MNNKIRLLLALYALSTVYSINNNKANATQIKQKSLTYSIYRHNRSALKAQVENQQLQSSGERLGNFLVGTSLLKLPILCELGDEGFHREYINFNGEKRPVAKTPNGDYMLTLTLDELVVFGDRNLGCVLLARDTLGRDRAVVMINGDGLNPMAIHPDTGVWREARKLSTGEIYLGHRIDIENLSPEVKNNVNATMFKLFENSNYNLKNIIEK